MCAEAFLLLYGAKSLRQRRCEKATHFLALITFQDFLSPKMLLSRFLSFEAHPSWFRSLKFVMVEPFFPSLACEQALWKISKGDSEDKRTAKKGSLLAGDPR